MTKARRKLSPESAAFARQVLLRRRSLLEQLKQLPSFRGLARELHVSQSCIRRIDQGLAYRGE